MKTKLLKKLHKRYNWYFNKDGFPVLIDHIKKEAFVYDVEFLCNRFGYKVEDLPTLVKVPLTEWALRNLKMDILKEYGWSMRRCNYKAAMSSFIQRLPK